MGGCCCRRCHGVVQWGGCGIGRLVKEEEKRGDPGKESRSIREATHVTLDSPTNHSGTPLVLSPEPVPHAPSL